MTKKFRHSAGFGKRMEYWIIGLMLKEGLGACRRITVQRLLVHGVFPVTGQR